jgi:hypothetical protein
MMLEVGKRRKVKKPVLSFNLNFVDHFILNRYNYQQAIEGQFAQSACD